MQSAALAAEYVFTAHAVQLVAPPAAGEYMPLEQPKQREAPSNGPYMPPGQLAQELEAGCWAYLAAAHVKHSVDWAAELYFPALQAVQSPDSNKGEYMPGEQRVHSNAAAKAYVPTPQTEQLVAPVVAPPVTVKVPPAVKVTTVRAPATT